MFFSCSGLVESAGSLEWELLSIVDNKQRGSQERMIEKLRYAVEHKQQSTSESEKIHSHTLARGAEQLVGVCVRVCVSVCLSKDFLPTRSSYYRET